MWFSACLYFSINLAGGDCAITLAYLHVQKGLLVKPVRGGLRSATDTTRLMVPKIYSRTFKSAADKAFCFNAPRLWNHLPISVRTSISIPAFKKGLKTHMFAQV